MSHAQSQSIRAYDIPERVAAYDADMELMHPNRSKMADVILELLPFQAEAQLVALDLGVGTGFFSKAILTRFPNCCVIAIDGAAFMIEMAKARLGALTDRVDFRIGDFRFLKKLLSERDRLDLVFSAYALHHLTAQEKVALTRDVVGLLKPGGWFLKLILLLMRTQESKHEFRRSGWQALFSAHVVRTTAS